MQGLDLTAGDARWVDVQPKPVDADLVCAVRPHSPEDSRESDRLRWLARGAERGVLRLAGTCKKSGTDTSSLLLARVENMPHINVFLSEIAPWGVFFCGAKQNRAPARQQALLAPRSPP